jgi:hypothetical protein
MTGRRNWINSTSSRMTWHLPVTSTTMRLLLASTIGSCRCWSRAGTCTPYARQFPLTLGKRKTGAETAPCAMEILQELSHDMEAAVGQEDFTACDRIYDRFLAERKNGVVSRSNVEHSHDTPETRQPQDEEWTRPRTKPSRV